MVGIDPFKDVVESSRQSHLLARYNASNAPLLGVGNSHVVNVHQTLLVRFDQLASHVASVVNRLETAPPEASDSTQDISRPSTIPQAALERDRNIVQRGLQAESSRSASDISLQKSKRGRKLKGCRHCATNSCNVEYRAVYGVVHPNVPDSSVWVTREGNITSHIKTFLSWWYKGLAEHNLPPGKDYCQDWLSNRSLRQKYQQYSAVAALWETATGSTSNECTEEQAQKFWDSKLKSGQPFKHAKNWTELRNSCQGRNE